ncbi:MAG: Trk system potassium transporter TrkA [Desulfobacterales bacterium]
MKIVIVGAGEVGFHTASRLAIEDKDVVVIDKDADAIRRVSEAIDVQVITGSGSSPVVLAQAGIKEADMLLAVTDSDETNLVACLVAHVLSPTTKKLARIRAGDFDAYHDVFRDESPHIDTIINPEAEVVKKIESLMRVPGAVDVGEFEAGRIKFVGIILDEDTQLAGIRLSALATHLGKPSPLIAAIIRDGELIIPRGDDRLLIGDTVYIVSEEDKLADTLAMFSKHADPVRRVLIVGGGRLAYRLAKVLEEKSIATKLIERNQDRCVSLAERLSKTVVLHGDGSDQSLLSEENVADMDVVVSLTNDEETNILVSLLAKQMGARKTITKITKFSYFPLMSTIGLDLVVSPRLSAINSILQHVRKGKVVSTLAIKGEQAEFMEAVALETSDIVGKPIKDIKFPKGALVTSIIRGEKVIIPSGSSTIEPEDRIIIFTRRQDIDKIEKILAVSLEYF